MASILMMAGGAILNTAAFTGGIYLARYLSGDSGKAALAEKRGTTKLSKIIRPHKPNTCATEPSFWIGSKLTEKSKTRHTRICPCQKRPSSLTSISLAKSRNKASLFC